MNHYWRILSYARPYKKQILLSVVFNILMVLFSLVSITILIPILKIIFNNTQTVHEVIPYEGILSLRVWLESWLNFKITNWAAIYGKQGILLRILIFTAILFLLKNICRYIGTIALVFIKNAVERDLRNDIHKKLLELPIAFFTEKRKGDILTRLTTDITEIQWALLSSIQRMVQDPLMIISTITLLIILSPQLTLFVVLLIPVTGFLITYIGNTLKRHSEKAKEDLGQIMSFVEEHISGLPIIRSYVAEDQVDKKFQKTNQSYFDAMNEMLYRRELSSPVSELLGSSVIIGIIWYGSTLILKNNALEPEVFITYVALFYQIINPAKSISNAIYDIKRGEASSNRILSFLDAPNPLADAENALAKAEFSDKICLEKIHFAYEQTKVLQDVTFCIKKGETVALVGQSGSGKSTVTYLLNRFYDIQDGAIKIDGQDIRKIKQKDLRKLIGYISQDAILFHDSIRNNLLMGNPEATEDDIIHAAKIANAHDFIMATPNGYETNIGDRGTKLSGGQRQRLTIARAILKNPPILILDEATSALDSESEMLVQEALEKLMNKRTSIVIAHRLSTVQNADKIIVMKAGKVIESGTHESLMEAGGEYLKLVALQRVD